MGWVHILTFYYYTHAKYHVLVSINMSPHNTCMKYYAMGRSPRTCNHIRPVRYTAYSIMLQVKPSWQVTLIQRCLYVTDV